MGAETGNGTQLPFIIRCPLSGKVYLHRLRQSLAFGGGRNFSAGILDKFMYLVDNRGKEIHKFPIPKTKE